MMHFLNNYGLFLVKLISVVIAILVVFAGILAIANKGKSKGKLSIKPLNDKYKEYTDTLLATLHDKKKIKACKKEQKKHKQQHAKNHKRIFLLNFNGDIRASQLNALREEITALLLVANPNDDEVFIRLESGGGLVNAYGLAASQLQRIKTANLKMTVAIDKVAASGGYMMACIADRVIAAPFAIIGSIGVIAQLPNFHDFLQDKHINFEQITAGEYKRTLTLFGENTEQGREKMQDEVDETHQLFKDHIQQFRPSINIDQVATGEHWFAQKAQTLNLVDELQTSDDALLNKSKTHQIYEISYQMKKSLPQKLASNAVSLWHKLITRPTSKHYL